MVTKHPGDRRCGECRQRHEQLVYEMGDPRTYITPDGVADFTTIRLKQDGKDRVRVSGIRGRERTDKLKVSIAYFYGYKAVGTLVYSGRRRTTRRVPPTGSSGLGLNDLGLTFEQVLTEFVGVDATHGPLAGPPHPDIPEVQLRVGVRSPDKAAVERFTREIAPLVLTRPPSVTGFAGGRPEVQEVVAYWPALIDRREIEPFVRVDVL